MFDSKTITAAVLAALLPLAASAASGPEEDRLAFSAYFENRFPDVEREEYGNGAYAIDSAAREQWLQYEEFPPYEIYVDDGQELFETPFANGSSYADCFENGGIGIRQNYPRWDDERGEVVTLEYAINLCREANGEKALKYSKGDMAKISAYMAYTSRDNRFDVTIPNDAAQAAYDAGKEFYYSKRGQLNFSCADCHVRSAGMRVRVETLSPGLGHTTGFPVYRSKWQDMGTLHRRFAGCNNNIRAVKLKAQGPEYRNLEYFLSYMSNGLAVNGPSARK